jgi:hypothetical protein
VTDKVVMHASSGAWVVGTLILTDSVTEGSMLARIDLDFTSVLGRQVSCFTPGRGLVQVQMLPEVQLNFTPGAADCGFAARGGRQGDTVVGYWYEDSFIGPRTVGRFRMSRTL